MVCGGLQPIYELAPTARPGLMDTLTFLKPLAQAAQDAISEMDNGHTVRELKQLRLRDEFTFKSPIGKISDLYTTAALNPNIVNQCGLHVDDHVVSAAMRPDNRGDGRRAWLAKGQELQV